MQLLLSALLVLTHVHATAAVAEQQVPRQPYQIVDFAPPPTSLSELWEKSPVVARVRILAATPRELPSASLHAPPTLVTVHAAKVLEVLKGGKVKAGDSIDVIVPVGSAPMPEGPRRVAIADGMRAFNAREELVVFLNPWDAAGGYGISFGPVGHYRVDTGDVTLPESAQAWKSFAGRGRTMPAAEFLTVLRSLRTGPKGL